MHKITRITRCLRWALVILMSLYFFSACEKRGETEAFVPFLTGRIWKGDTITINPPTTYTQLSIADQQSFNSAGLRFRDAQLTFNEDATVTTGGDYDPGYTKWRLVNNGADIEVTLSNGSTSILRNWVADAVHFSYTILFTTSKNNSFDCTLIYK